MTKFFLRWIINAAALYAAIFLLDGHGVDFSGNWTSIIWLALIFGLVNAFLRPLLTVLTCPLIILTLGLFLASWVAYDIWAVAKYGLDGGKTISWTIYSESLGRPAIPFLTGLVIGLVCGHFFLGMDR